MNEWVPILIGGVLGCAVFLTGRGRLRTVASASLVAAAGTAAAVFSGEYQLSWAYVLVDAGEAAAGLGAGWAVAALLRIIAAAARSASRARADLPRAIETPRG
jgi:hypothetical protein